MLITTANTLEGYTIDKYLGPINVNEVVGANFLSDFFASITDVLGGTSGTYRSKMDDLYRYAIKGLENKASLIGANAIIGFSLDFDEISGKGKSMFMVSALGTAVSISADRYVLFKKLSELKTFFDESLISSEEYEREKQRIRSQYDNHIEIETEQLAYEQELLEERQREREEAMKLREIKIQQELKRKEQNAFFLAQLSKSHSLNDYNVGDIIEIIETGDCTSIEGFTEDGRIACLLNGECKILSLDDVKPLES